MRKKMIKKLIADIRKNSNFIVDDEVELFRIMAKELLKITKGVFVDETHGKVANVTFDSIRGILEQCEISDLLIITVNKHQNDARATFWQAKKDTKSKWIKNTTSHSMKNACFDFKGQFNQWELLSYRPQIGPVAKFSPPKNLLSSFYSPSIGSFGVFYEQFGNLELNYSVAEFISSTTLPIVRRCSKSKAQSNMVINGKLSKYNLYDEEKIVCENMYDFFDALLNNKIGAKIDTRIYEHSWLINYIKSQVTSSKNINYGNNSENFNNYFFPDIPRDENFKDDFSEGLSMLIIDTTEVDIKR
jgi:hypothetical protein